MTANVRLGFIGLGTMGRDLLREAVKCPRANVAALCDLEDTALRAAAELATPDAIRYTDYHELMHSGAADGVVVATPQDSHARIAMDALDAGLHVFCEKPMALNVEDCEAMIAAAQENGKSLMIGQVLRYVGVYRFVLETALSGVLGRPFAVRILRSMGKWGTWARPWRSRRSACGGMLFEVHVHEIDFMRCLLGEARGVFAMGDRFVNDEVDYEDFLAATIAFDRGVGSLTASCSDHIGKYEGEVSCEKGTIYYDSLSQLVRIGKEGADKEEIPYASIHPEWESGVHREIREFTEACLGEHPPTIPGEEGLRNVEIAEACQVSLSERRLVGLPLRRI